MTWKQLAAYVAGAASIAAGSLVPGLQALIPLGAGLAGWATRWPEHGKSHPDKRIGKPSPPPAEE